MDAVDPSSLVTTIIGGGTAGLIAFLVLVLVLGSRGTWVWGRDHEKEVAGLQSQLDKVSKERDEWKELALGTTDLLERIPRRAP